MFENHIIDLNKFRNVWKSYESYNSYHIESGHGLGQVQTCLAIFLSDKNWYDCIILCHMSIYKSWFGMVWIFENFENFENGVFWTFSVLGATYERSWTQFFESCFPSNKQLQKENSGFVKTSDEHVRRLRSSWVSSPAFLYLLIRAAFPVPEPAPPDDEAPGWPDDILLASNKKQTITYKWHHTIKVHYFIFQTF